jgi:putative ABC transport system permease protein
MEALRLVVPTSAGGGNARRTVGWVMTALGVTTLGVCAVLGNQRWGTLVATVIAFVGLFVAGPSLARGMARLADHGRRGGGWRMASRNIARNSQRAAASALALTIGLTVVAAVAVTATSMKESVSAAVSGGNRSDLILEPGGAGLGISPSVAELLRRRDDVVDVVELRETSAQVDGRSSLVSALDTEGLDRVVDLGIETGSLDDLQPGSILVSTTAADELGVRTGSTVTMTFPETGDTTMRVAGTFSKGSLINATYVLSMPDFAANVTSPLDGAILLTTTRGKGPAQAKQDIEAALADYPNVTVNDPADVRTRSTSSWGS